MDGLKLTPGSDLKYSVSYRQSCLLKAPLILAVDDDEDNLLLLTYTLEPLNCSVITAFDGKSALEAARIQQPDLILLDIMLYPVDGIEIVAQLKRDPRTMNIPVVAVTALAREEDKQRILHAGCNDYISKPYMLDDMEALIRRYVGEAMSA
jgi:two-component system cell cycle response regulator DivK